jgi:hypothetical protein
MIFISRQKLEEEIDRKVEEEFRKRADLLMKNIKADDVPKSEIPAVPRGLKEE